MGRLGPRAVLFDLDGTMIDSFTAIAASVNHVRALYELPPLGVAEVTRHVGRGPALLLRDTVGQGDEAANVEAYRTHHPTVYREMTRLLPGAKEALHALKRQGRMTGICSNKPIAFTRDLVVYLGIAEFLDVILGPEDAGRHKPAPDMLLLAMQRLGTSPESTLYIGDMIVDIETGRAAGVPVWVTPTGSDTLAALQAAAPDRLLSGLEEVPGLLA